MTGLILAVALAVWSAGCVAAGGWYVHRRYTARLNLLAQYERATRREVEFRKAIPAGWYERQMTRMNASAIRAAHLTTRRAA